jgi:RHS repeat-associated protein
LKHLPARQNEFEGRLASLVHDLAGTAADQTAGYAYNPASQIVTRTGSNDAYAAPPEAAHSLAYQVNGLNQYTQASNRTYSYDANGNLVSVANPGVGTTSYVYDVENRLVSASGLSAAALVYDPLGRLFQVSGASGAWLQFLYDGDALVAEYDGAQTRPQVYVHGVGQDVPLVWYEGAAGGRRLYADHQGSIVAIAHPLGAYMTINAYDAWGIPNAGNKGRFGYTGQAWVPELGLWYYKARFYSPTLGRFMQSDPVGYDGGLNIYAYVENDPINRVDPGGTNPACAPECFNQDPGMSPLTQAKRDLVGADYWEASFANYRQGNYLKAAGYAFLGAIGLGMPESEGPIHFAQTSFSRSFSDVGRKFYSSLAGRAIETVGDLTNALVNGFIGPESIPVEFVKVDGKRVILNTRTSAALMDAKINVKDWNLVDKTGDKEAMRRLQYQLRNNELSPTGTRIRPTER